MAGISKRIRGSWVSSDYGVMKTATDIITTLPAVIYPNDTTATVGLKGNTAQNDTPTPQNPVMPNGTGERTGNLFDKSKRTDNSRVVYTTGEIGSLYSVFVSDFIPIEPNTTYTLNIVSSISGKTGHLYALYDVNKNFVDTGAHAATPATEYTFTTPSDIAYIRFNGNMASVDEIMLNKGSTSLPYEPYGFKIPILSNSTTTPVYLGEVQSTRQIKKYEFTGLEEWRLHTSQANLFTLSTITDYLHSINLASICSHYTTKNVAGAVVAAEDNLTLSFYYNSANPTASVIYVKDTSYSIAADFKTYLQQQYSAGTPVTVWYILATETTGILNEPLRKIGTYADEVSGITIPVTAGANTISVNTTLQPSEVSVNYHGWHPVQSVHVYPDSSWMPTSWEEFRKAVRSGKAQSLYPVGTKLYENWGDTTSDAWIVVDYPTGEDYLDSDLAQQGYTNRVMLMEEKLNYLRQFDAIEAWLYVETAIPAGTYRFTIPNYDASYGGNKTYIFTSTANVPVGGQLTLTWNYQQNPSAVQAYSSATSTSALFNVSITEWDGTTACTDLGTIKLAQNDPDSTYGKLNHIHRVRYGSNNYYQSGYRQWLNADAAANTWWTPSNIFDRPYGNRTNAGRLNVMNSNMKSVLATPTVNCITNNLFEYPSLDGTTFALQTAYTVKDKLFPVTHTEVNLSSSPNVNSVLDYYVGAQNADRIKYRKDNGNAYYWWLRTPHPTSAYTVRGVHTSGALSNNVAYNTLGSAAACIIQ